MGILFNPITAQFETNSCQSGGGSASSIITGTDDGTLTGTQYVFVNNIFKQILSAEDRVEQYTYADAGTRNERITMIEYSSATVHSGTIAKKTISYTLTGNSYTVTNITRSLV